MAEGRGLEPLIAFLRSLGVASRHNAALSAFRGGAGWIRTISVSLYRRVHCQLMLPRQKNGPGGGIRTHRLLSLSQAHVPVLLLPAGTDGRIRTDTGQRLGLSPLPIGLRRQLGGPHRIRTCTDLLLGQVSLPVGLEARRSVRDSNPQPVGYGVAVFKTADLPIGLTLRERSIVVRMSYASSDRRDRLRSEV